MTPPPLLAGSLMLGFREFQTFWSPTSWFFGFVVRLACVVAMWSLLGRLVGTAGTYEYITVGNVLLAGATASLWVVASTAWDKMDSVFGLLISSPLNYCLTTSIRGLVWLINSIVVSLLLFTFTLSPAFDIPHHALSSPLSLAIAVALSCVSTYSLGLFVGFSLSRMPGYRNTAAGLAGAMLAIFSGVNVPHTYWPAWVDPLAMLLPLYHGLDAVRELLNPTGADVGALILSEFGVASLWYLAATLACKFFLASTRQSGVLEIQ